MVTPLQKGSEDCMCSCVRGWGAEIEVSCFLSHSLPSLRQGLSLNHEAWSQLDWWPAGPRDPPVFPSPVRRLQVHTWLLLKHGC